MPEHTATPGAPCWVDLFTTEPENAHEFYGRVFGWSAESAGEEYGGYVNYSLGGKRLAGCMKNDGQGGPDQWTVYLASPDAKATTDAAAARGGVVIVPAMDVADLGAMAVIADPGGAGVGVWQPAVHQGFEVYEEVGTPTWFELHTRDYETSLDFYRNVFNWDTSVASDTPDFRYSTLGEGDASRAGVMDISAWDQAAPVGWSVYFGVADTDASLSTITEAGGTVLMPAEDTPYGRLAMAADPTGATFKLVGTDAG